MRVRKLVLISMFIAIIAVMTIVPNLGYIPFGAISITLLHIPVLLLAFIYGLKEATFMGLVFGFSSFLKACIAPQTIMDVFFANPLVSILPRLLFGLFIGLLNYLDKKELTNFKILLYSLIATLLHTFLVMSSVYIFFFEEVAQLYPGISYLPFLGMFVLNGTLEGVFGGIVSIAVLRVFKRRNKLEG